MINRFINENGPILCDEFYDSNESKRAVLMASCN